METREPRNAQASKTSLPLFFFVTTIPSSGKRACSRRRPARVHSCPRCRARIFVFYCLRLVRSESRKGTWEKHWGSGMAEEPCAPSPFTSRTPRFLPFVGDSLPKPEYASWRRGVRMRFAFAPAQPGWFAIFARLTSRAMGACFGRRALCCAVERKLPLTSSRSSPSTFIQQAPQTWDRCGQLFTVQPQPRRSTAPDEIPLPDAA